jgi:FkbM family methyltransferase
MRIFSLIKVFLIGGLKGHFGQYGEDIIIHKIFSKRINNGFYIDIGSFHPFRYSNTAYLWLRGWSGINVDANQKTIDKFKSVRPDDINVYGAVVAKDFAKKNRTIAIYASDSAINPMGTCDQASAVERGFTVKAEVPAIAVEEILSMAGDRTIDFLNIDIEGLDQDVIQEIDFNRYKPKVICIEDAGESIPEILTTKITTTLSAAGYSLDYRIGPSSIFRLVTFKIE